MAEINLPYNNTGRVAYRSNLDSSIVNEIFRKSDENDRYIMKLINAIMGKNAQWSAVITYNKYDIVGTGKDIYMSKRDSNLNKVVTNADWWEKIDVGSLDVSDQLTKYALKEELPEWVVSETEPTSKDKIWIKPTASNELTELVETLKRLLAPELQTLPIGAYINYPTQRVIPAGFLIADGRSLKKSEYPELFNVLGYVYGGSGENFNLPNFSDGKFMRSIGGNAAGLGVVQQDAIDVNGLQLRSLVTDNVGNRNTYGTTSSQEYRGVAYTYSNTGAEIAYKSVAGKEDKPIFATSKPANETRPLNMSVVVLIKAKDVISPSAGQIDKTIVATEAKAGVVKLKNSITAQQEDAAVTEKAVAEAIEANKGIGVGQTWQDVKDQRQAGITYTNTTGRPIMVCIQATMNYGVATCPIFVDGIKVGEVWEHHAVNKVDNITFIVPNGSTYKADLTIGINTISIWSELR